MHAQVLGNAKGVAAVFISIALFRNPFSAAAAGGYLLTLGGVVAYAAAKRSSAAPAPGLQKQIQQGPRTPPRLSPRMAAKP